MGTLLRHLRDVRTDLPAAGAVALDVAERFWSGEVVDEDSLLNAKVRVWAAIDSGFLTSRQAELMRALLGVLEPDGGEEEIDMTAEWFSAMLWHEV